ncbi:hypothetical protein BDV96DRAFT_192929 [Lophiotrema nucula]|uniref:Uncharacterized protein n=1 Tax=Lophiotrema nucula TaxID=690887 RepID=A0A6A5YUK8_9PLEO|nr:hypothetical protein BDV96DRAFT_192929 [Lophiotrema nucula]
MVPYWHNSSAGRKAASSGTETHSSGTTRYRDHNVGQERRTREFVLFLARPEDRIAMAYNIHHQASIRSSPATETTSSRRMSEVANRCLCTVEIMFQGLFEGSRHTLLALQHMMREAFPLCCVEEKWVEILPMHLLR